MSIDLTASTQHVAALLSGVRDEHLTAPTPCGEYTVAALLDHIMGFSSAFTWIARKQDEGLSDDPPHARAEDLDPRWRELLPGRLTELGEAWRDPAADEGQARAAGVELPRSVWRLVALNELLVHGWDLATATGQPYRTDPAAVAVTVEFMGQDADDPASRENNPAFGPIVTVPDDAPAIDRAVGLSGRDPGWKP
ncbi:TIGR03086 family metal-binding protein [Stackebrandtia nassauensis]|uniref:Mycothiol-dependent maleylpyruvate isomerase metal-binding domain-containing protein n=1 Tax=Stackebrandtia nassauensis (strain DSM 44728 / CIP 108903 / NRRL B-16338 / NBRC 102104 / LLR-40K-21) TaxID=446470 RepID=D3PV55_STANL|nr:TIGR03086 family metal-binding protein [Stackebrandtia nassauensis]ADD41108.1 hypothetical protein Snas_1401 [Stackebrandtia nassauensis DSM 44728]